MPLTISAVLALATAPLWATAAGLAAQRFAAQRRELQGRAAARSQAIDEVVVALAWAHEVEVVRAGPAPGGVIVRGLHDGQRFVVELGGQGDERPLAQPSVWRVAVDVQPLLPAGVEIAAWAADERGDSEGREPGLGHPSFDRSYRVTPAERAEELAPGLVEILGRRALIGLHLRGDRLIRVGDRLEPGRAGAELEAVVRELLALARALEAQASRRPSGARRQA